MANDLLFTSESVSEGHSGEIADPIYDTMLDALLREDVRAQGAVETMVKTGMAIIASEVTTTARVDLEDVTHRTMLDIGHNTSDLGFYGRNCAVLNSTPGGGSPRAKGAGDQRPLVSYAANDNESPIYVAHKLMERQAHDRKNRTLPRPEFLARVTAERESDRVRS